MAETQNDWYGASLETETQPLINDGSGKPIVLRQFEFKLPPSKERPTPEQLLAAHKTRLIAFLWRDELVPIMDMKVVIAKDGASFKVFSACQAKAGSVILEKPEVIQNVLNAKSTE